MMKRRGKPNGACPSFAKYKKNFMKKIGILIAGLLWVCVVHAEPIKFSDAAQRASKMLGKKVVAAQQQANQARARLQAASSPAFYVFNAEDGRGFVIISGDDKMPEVVAYSNTNHFDLSDMHPGLVDMLDFYTEVLDDVRKGVVTLSAPRKVSSEHPGVEPLCETSWGQSEPYNNLCPQSGSGERCVTGCVATAMAQIVYYHQWPEKGTGTPSYFHPTFGQLTSNLNEHTYDWSVMKPTHAENKASDDASKAVAQLCYDCGVAVHMDYGVDGSGASESHAASAFYQYFGYRSSTIEQKERKYFDSQEEWNELLISELDAKRPVLYSGIDPMYGGHEFIIDGYDVEGNFHVNWGWHGTANDGYYSILSLDPQGVSPAFTFCNEQSMVIGIIPDPTGLDRQCRVSMKIGPSVDINQKNLGASFIYSHGAFYNNTTDTHKWVAECGLYNMDGELLNTLRMAPNSYEIPSGSGYSSMTSYVIIPDDTPNGYYTLRSIFKQVEKDADDNDLYNEYMLPITRGPSDMNQVYVQVANGVAYFNVEIKSELELELYEGWNWISHNVATALDPLEIFGDNVVEVKSQTKGLFRDEKFGMVGNLTTMNATEAYKVKTSTADTDPYQLTGLLFNARLDAITLRTGWNWIGYPLSHTQTIAGALANYTPQEGDVIVGQDAFAEYADGAWSDPDLVLTPGKGYLYKSGVDTELMFNVDVPVAAKQRDAMVKVTTDHHWQCDKHRYPNVLPLTASLVRGEGTINVARYDVAAFCGDECRGVGRVVKNRVMMNVYGQGGETITFCAFDKETGETLPLQESVAFVPDVLGSVKAPFRLTFDGDATDIASIREDGTTTTTIYYTIDGRPLRGVPSQRGLYIRNGKKVFIR